MPCRISRRITKVTAPTTSWKADSGGVATLPTRTEGENGGADASAEQHRQGSRRTESSGVRLMTNTAAPTNGTRLATVARSPRTSANIAAASRVPKTVYAATKKGLARG